MGWGRLIYGKGARLAAKMLGSSEKNSAPTQITRPEHDLLTNRQNLACVQRWVFCATLQLRTPLRVLMHHGEIATGPDSGLPVYTDEMWQGIWIPEDEDDELSRILSQGRTMASEVGSIPEDGGDYMHFLRSFRAITEGSRQLHEKEDALRELLQQFGPGGTAYSKFYNPSDLIEQVLPSVLTMLPVTKPVVANLFNAGLSTLGKVDRAEDARLLAIKGLGPKSLADIRSWLAKNTHDLGARRYLCPEYAN